MKKISESIKKELREPFGKIYLSAEDIMQNHSNLKIVAVGDQTVLSFLRIGVKPHVSVFDFKTLRKRIPKKDIEYLKKTFPNLKVLRNIQSTVSRRLMQVAPLFLRSGGSLRVYGEEDLTALVFIYFANRDTIVVYGQYEKGLIVVEPYKCKKRVEDLMDKILPSFFP